MVSLTEALIEYQLTARISSRSVYGLFPGDIIHFNYGSSSRFGIVVASERTSNGMFLSTKNNLLLNVFLLDSLSLGMFELVIHNLYRNRVRCSYSGAPKILGAFLGRVNYRTFDIRKISKVIEFIV